MKQFALGFFRKMTGKDIGTYAASTAFFMFLSILPIMTLVFLLLPLTGFASDAMVSMVTDVTPGFIDELVTEIILEAYGKTGGILPLTVIVIIFSAAQGMTALIRGLRLVYDIRKQGSVLFLNLLGVLSTLAITLFLIAAAIGLVVANSLFQRIVAEQITINFFAQVILRLRYVIMLALFILLLTLLYALISGSKKNPKLHIPGAVFSSVACAVFTWIFSLYVQFNNGYNAIYGGFASTIVMFLWGYICIYLILVGGCLNRYLMDRREGKDTDAPAEGSEEEIGTGLRGILKNLFRKD